MDIREEICKSVDIILKQRLANQGNDYTIKGEIVECLDESTGAYKIKYQDSYFTAYSSDSTFIYTPGSIVSITVSSGDFSNIKRINSGLNDNAISFLPIINLEDVLYRISDNIFDETITYNLGSTENIFNINIPIVNKRVNYSLMNDANYFVLKADLSSTGLEYLEGKLNFGFKVILNVFKDLKVDDIIHEDYLIVEEGSDEGEEIKKTYYYQQKELYMTVADMESNPFVYEGTHTISKVFNIENEMIYNIKSVELFVDDAYGSEPFSLTFSNLQLYAANKYDQEKLSSSLFRIKGNLYHYFLESEDSDNKLILTAELLLRGRKVEFDQQQSTETLIYWFREDAEVDVGSEGYSAYAGAGWYCLNTRLYYSKTSFIYANGNPQIAIPLSSLGIKDRFKCIIHYGSNDRKIIESAYYVLENTYYRSENDYNPYTLKCYLNNNYIEDNRINTFNKITSNQTFYLKARLPEQESENFYQFYWSKSDANGTSTLINNNGMNNLPITSKDISNYAYYTCTVKDANKNIIYDEAIKIVNQENIYTLSEISDTDIVITYDSNNCRLNMFLL